jgi:hypothetical protein
VPAAKRLDGVDLRIGVPDVEVARVVAAFGLDTDEASERAIHLMENLSSAPARLTTAGGTVWLECAPTRREVVVQLRPVRHAQLGPYWCGFQSDSGHRLRIAEEWTGTQRVLVATLTASLDAGGLAAVLARPLVAVVPGRGLLSARQRDFLADCAGLVALEDRLTLLGPIRERAWTLRRHDISFRVRRWTARRPGCTTGLDLVDLEAQTSAADAPFLFPALRSIARQQQVDTEAELDPIAIRAAIWASANQC